MAVRADAIDLEIHSYKYFDEVHYAQNKSFLIAIKLDGS